MNRSIRNLVGVATASVIMTGAAIATQSAAHASTPREVSIAVADQPDTPVAEARRNCWYRWVDGRRVRVCRFG